MELWTRGVFVTGTDTGVGKTVVAAWLTRALDADYWKPIQAGLEDETDTATVRRLTGLPHERFHESAYRLEAPLSPHEAARREGIVIELDRIRLPAADRLVVVEGAGGVMVPINDRAFMADLIARLGLPAVVVARSGLGTINHTLLTLESLEARGVAVAGVVMNGPPNEANRRAIETFGAVSVIAEFPLLEPLEAGTLAAAAARLAPVLDRA
ncbi:MAG: dethiobiotin synthase [Alphaproteobacteria bacterium]